MDGLHAPTFRHLIRIFVREPGIGNTAIDVKRVSEAFGRGDLQVQTLQQLSLTAQRLFTPLHLVSPSDGFQVIVSPESIDVARVLIDRVGHNMDSFASFAASATVGASELLTSLGRSAHRLAAVTEGFLPESFAVEELPERLLHRPSFFVDHPPFEWDWRVAARCQRRFSGVDEELHHLVTIKRVNGSWGGTSPEKFDRVRLDLDVNTMPSLPAERFGAEEVAAFFQEAPNWISELAAGVRPMLEGPR